MHQYHSNASTVAELYSAVSKLWSETWKLLFSTLPLPCRTHIWWYNKHEPVCFESVCFYNFVGRKWILRVYYCAGKLNKSYELITDRIQPKNHFHIVKLYRQLSTLFCFTKNLFIRNKRVSVRQQLNRVNDSFCCNANKLPSAWRFYQKLWRFPCD